MGSLKVAGAGRFTHGIPLNPKRMSDYMQHVRICVSVCSCVCTIKKRTNTHWHTCITHSNTYLHKHTCIYTYIYTHTTVIKYSSICIFFILSLQLKERTRRTWQSKLRTLQRETQSAILDQLRVARRHWVTWFSKESEEICLKNGISFQPEWMMKKHILITAMTFRSAYIWGHIWINIYSFFFFFFFSSLSAWES